MKSKLLVLFSVGLLVSITSCNNDDDGSQSILNGEYNGIFTVEYSGGETFSNPVTVTFNNSKFLSSAGSNRMPAGGSGIFKIQNNTIVFQDENIWTAEFDWGLILSGDYELNIGGTTMEFLKANNNGSAFYKYELKRK